MSRPCGLSPGVAHRHRRRQILLLIAASGVVRQSSDTLAIEMLQRATLRYEVSTRSSRGDLQVGSSCELDAMLFAPNDPFTQS